MFRSISLFLLLAACVAFVGCGKTSADPALVAKHKKMFALAEEPENVQTVFEVREILLGHTEEGHDHEAEEHAEHSHEGETAEEHAAHAHDHEHDHEHVFPTEAKEVAMVGQIGGLANPWEETQPEFPFSTNFAVFFLADPQAVAENAEAGHVHAPGEECAFCAAHAEENSEQFAMIRLLDDKGKLIPIDVREMFNLTDNDTVVVKGSAQIVEGGMLVVKATGIYVRK
jgi:ABC-type Zn2+ transport system substrate-binding protein/surface adhesin